MLLFLKDTPSLKLLVDFGVWFFWWIFSWTFLGHFSLENEQEKIHRKIHDFQVNFLTKIRSDSSPGAQLLSYSGASAPSIHHDGLRSYCATPLALAIRARYAHSSIHKSSLLCRHCRHGRRCLKGATSAVLMVGKELAC